MKITYTTHAEDRLKKRKITREEVELATKYPDKTMKDGHKFIAQKDIGRGKIEVVYEKENYIKIITIYFV